MRTLFRKKPLTVFVAILAIAVVWIGVLAGLSDDSPELPQDSPNLDSVIDEGGLAVEQEPVQPQGLNTKPPVESMRSSHGPYAHQDEVVSTKEQTHILSIADQIDSALAGNIEDAFQIVSYARNCMGVAEDEASLYALIDFHKEIPELPLRMTNGVLGQPEEFDSFENWSTAQRHRFQNCQASRELFGNDLRARLKLLAQDGNAVARFMYAMWPPSPFVHDTEDLLDLLEYVDLSNEFSMRNMDELEPLGLLALGLSYKRLGLFTPVNPVIGDALLIAAEECGVPATIGDELTKSISRVSSDPVVVASEALVREFCK